MIAELYPQAPSSPIKTAGGSKCFEADADVNQYITNRGVIDLEDATLITPQLVLENGTLRGTGSIVGEVTNEAGRIEPGQSPGLLVIDGDYHQQTSATLAIELAGLEFDQLAITGEAELAGTLEISLIEGFDPLSAPLEQQRFEILTFASRTGEFESIVGRHVANGKFWDLIYDTDSLTLELAQAGTGDADLDGDVDLSDLSALAAHYGQNAGQNWLHGDFDGDGDVDLNDLSSLAANYGSGEAQAFADFQSLVPEPAGLGVLALLSAIRRARR